jgi:hypothetical protein
VTLHGVLSPAYPALLKFCEKHNEADAQSEADRCQENERVDTAQAARQCLCKKYHLKIFRLVRLLEVAAKAAPDTPTRQSQHRAKSRPGCVRQNGRLAFSPETFSLRPSTMAIWGL